MADNDTPAEKKVKELLEAGTRADLERWFGLPSYEQLKERGVDPAAPPAMAPPPTMAPADNPEFVEVRRKQAEALAAVDPAWIEAHRKRTEPRDGLIQFKPRIDVRVDPDISAIDLAMIERQHTIAEPREVEISEELREELREVTPQALLRDLHRPESTYDRHLEIIDYEAEQRVDLVAVVGEAMRTRWAGQEFPRSAFREGSYWWKVLRDVRHSPWTEIQMPGRKVTE